jgi:hypothetical protein
MHGAGALTRARDHDFDESLARLHESAALSEKQSRELERSNLQLATTLERERAARARIEAGLASRHVRPEQRTALIEALRGVVLDIAITKYNDPEASAYASEVSRALTDAGQNAKEGSTIMSATGHAFGVLVEEAADSRLINALFVAGIATQKIQSSRNDMFQTGTGLNAVIVGIKPNPF